jgi:hypothetical protein
MMVVVDKDGLVGLATAELEFEGKGVVVCESGKPDDPAGDKVGNVGSDSGASMPATAWVCCGVGRRIRLCGFGAIMADPFFFFSKDLPSLGRTEEFC